MGQFWPEKQINDAGHGGRSIIDHFPVDIIQHPVLYGEIAIGNDHVVVHQRPVPIFIGQHEKPMDGGSAPTKYHLVPQKNLNARSLNARRQGIVFRNGRGVLPDRIGAVLRRAVPVENGSVRGHGKGRVLVVHPRFGIRCPSGTGQWGTARKRPAPSRPWLQEAPAERCPNLLSVSYSAPSAFCSIVTGNKTKIKKFSDSTYSLFPVIK